MSAFKVGDYVKASPKLIKETFNQVHRWCTDYGYSINDLCNLKLRVVSLDYNLVQVETPKGNRHIWSLHTKHLVPYDLKEKTKQELVIDKIKYLDKRYELRRSV